METVASWQKRRQFELTQEDIIDGLLCPGAGYVVVAGRTGIGKSVFTMQLAFSLATGTDFLGMIIKRKVNVGMFLFEGSSDKVDDRFTKMSKSFSSDARQNIRFELRKPPFHINKNFSNIIKQVEGCEVVIFDPGKYMVFGDYISVRDANKFAEILLDLAEIGNFIPIICWQIRKPNNNSLIYPGDISEIKGAADYVESSATTFLLEKARRGHRSGGPGSGTEGRGFAPTDPDKVTLYLCKARDSERENWSLELQLNREKLLFEPLNP